MSEKEQRTVTTVQIKKELMKELKKRAAEDEVPVSSYLEEILRKYLNGKTRSRKKSD